MTEEIIVRWITSYGYFGIFFLLIFGIVGLPVPDEWLLVIAGYLAFKEVLGLFPTLVIAAIGTVSGLTVSYVLGRNSGGYLIRRHGRWLALDETKMLRARQWLQKGRWVLLIGPFIPGLRNLMGYVAGASGLRLQTYARFAYSGALLSSTTFVTFGYLAGRHVHWNHSILPLIALGLIISISIVNGLRGSRLFAISNDSPVYTPEEDETASSCDSRDARNERLCVRSVWRADERLRRRTTFR